MKWIRTFAAYLSNFQEWFVVRFINCFGSFCGWDVNMPSSYSFAVHGFRHRMHCWRRCRRSRLTHWSASGAFQGYRPGSWVHNWDPELYWKCGWRENKGQHPQYTRIFLWTHSATFDTISASMPSYHLFLWQAVYLLKIKKGMCQLKGIL